MDIAAHPVSESVSVSVSHFGQTLVLSKPYSDQKLSFEPSRVKTNSLGLEQGPTQTSLYCHRRTLEA